MILFDLDGTISDPIKGIARSINYALAALGFEEVSESRIANFIGIPLDETFAAFCETKSGKLVDQLVIRYRERFSAVGYSENVLYPGVREVLIDLHEKGVRLAVCTSKRADYARRILQMFELDRLFRFVNGGDVGISKERQIATMLADGKITGNTMMIGDRFVDLAAAHASGLASAGVLWGYGSREELERESPFRLFRSPAEWHILADLAAACPKEPDSRQDSGHP
ncbi:MAG: HAD hydrolase-like protein [Gammaproteobacteria bacterium]|nr:HAD hydrolase-like protein [Gammaproteobacteria bacterium]